MKKSNIMTCIVAIVAIVAIVLCVVTNGKKADLQKQVDELKANMTTLTGNLDAAKQEAADAAKNAEEQIAKAKEEAGKAVEEATAAAKADAEAEIAKVKADAEKALEDAKAEAAKALEEAKAAAETAAQTVTETVTETAAEAVAEVTEAVEKAVEEAPAAEVTAAEAPAAEAKTVMTHAEYAAADLDTEVTVEAYVQGKQSWWADKATIYLQAEDGAYFVYELPISEEDYAKLENGVKVRVTGYKSEWSGEVEITDATFEILDAEPWIAQAEDITALLGKDELVNHQNEVVAVKGVTVEAYDETGAAFAYKNAADKTDDLYFKVSKDGQTYEFCVEFYLCGKDTDVYKAVEALKVGDVIDLEGFLYWYNGANLQATKLTPAAK